MELLIRQLVPRDKEKWLLLWHGYLEFYKQTLSDEQTELSWNRLLHSQEGLNALVAVSQDDLVGLAHFYWTPSTWTEHKDLYLEDLFVAPNVRKHGVGEALIKRLSEIAAEAGAKKIHWQTHVDNTVARKLYDRIANQSEFIVYEQEVQ